MSRDIGERDPGGWLPGRGNRSRPQARRPAAACSAHRSAAAERPPQTCTEAASRPRSGHLACRRAGRRGAARRHAGQGQVRQRGLGNTGRPGPCYRADSSTGYRADSSTRWARARQGARPGSARRAAWIRPGGYRHSRGQACPRAGQGARARRASQPRSRAAPSVSARPTGSRPACARTASSRASSSGPAGSRAGQAT